MSNNRRLLLALFLLVTAGVFVSAFYDNYLLTWWCVGLEIPVVWLIKEDRRAQELAERIKRYAPPPPSEPSANRVDDTTMALLDEVILIFPSFQVPVQVDPHRQLARFWEYEIPHGRWSHWKPEYYFFADFHYGERPAVRLTRAQADDDPMLHAPWRSQPT